MIFKALFGRKEDTSAPSVGGTKDLLTLTQPVDASPDRAFQVFVDEFDRWWPRDHTWGKERLAAIVIEPKMGGRCFERLNDGSEQIWGKVLAFDRPHHIVIAWQISPDRTPEESDGTASRVDVRFSPLDGGRTNVLVVHRDFFRHQGDWEKYRNDMASKKGWPTIMAAYAKAFGFA
jgi:uncharacterized protein YndB with AHSA1/START domain